VATTGGVVWAVTAVAAMGGAVGAATEGIVAVMGRAEAGRIAAAAAGLLLLAEASGAVGGGVGIAG